MLSTGKLIIAMSGAMLVLPAAARMPPYSLPANMTAVKTAQPAPI